MDIAAAFPSLSHAGMWHVLQRWGMHGRISTRIQAFYHMPIALLEMGGTRRPFFLASSAVAQRCLLSGTFWALIFDPPLIGINVYIKTVQRGIATACADELGRVLA
eukprot:4422737-Pyramimonas_sp.AAC.1